MGFRTKSVLWGMPIITNQPKIPARDRFKRQITLISHGYSCPEAFPDGKITVFPWDIHIDEWLQQRVKKGNADTVMLDLLPQLCDLNGCPPDQFVLGEVILIGLVSRSILREDILTLKATCSSCEFEFDESLHVPEQLSMVGEKEPSYSGTDLVTLPMNGDKVQIKPLLIGDHRQAITYSKRHTVSQRLTGLTGSIISIGGGTPDKASEVLDYLRSLHPKDFSFLERSIDQTTPHLSPKVSMECPSCGAVFDHSVQFDKEFFRAALAE